MSQFECLACKTRVGTSHGGVPGAGQPLADRVGEVIARREHIARTSRLEIERCDAHSVSPQVRVLRARASGTRMRPRRRALNTPAPPNKVPSSPSAGGQAPT
jgi:hypothetical protein